MVGGLWLVAKLDDYNFATIFNHFIPYRNFTPKAVTLYHKFFIYNLVLDICRVKQISL